MKYAKVHFPSREVSAKALHGLMLRGKIVGLRNRTFIVPDPALAWLDSEKLPCELVAHMNQDDVVQTLRDNHRSNLDRSWP